MSIVIRPADGRDIETVRTLFREYETELDEDLCFQSFEAELAELPGKYAEPRGALLVAEDGNSCLGVVALRPFEGSVLVCEMKRMYVRAAARKTGLGRRLAEAILEEGRRRGYRRIVLDTLPKLEPAIALYRSLGFIDIEPYYDNPIDAVVYLGRDL